MAWNVLCVTIDMYAGEDRGRSASGAPLRSVDRRLHTLHVRLLPAAVAH